MAGDQSDVDDVFNRLESHAMASGYFDSVNGHEPKGAPGNGLTVGVWVDNIRPVRSSGLNMTSARVVFFVRLYSNMNQEPQDAIDPAIARAGMDLMGAYTGDFDLGNTVREIDLLGSEGEELYAEAGYVQIDKATFRVLTIHVPVIFNDVWAQEPGA